MANRSLKVVISIVLLIAGLRLARVASQCESGWSFLLTQWQDASLGLVGFGYTPIGNSAPSEQAEFWLGEVNRIAEEHSHSASVHMGAAWILDSPGIGFLANHVRQSEFANAFPQMGPELDEEAISQAIAEFRDQCVGRCVEMAATATQNDPSDVRWWRMRALLLFEGDSIYGDEEFEPRNEEWLAVLKECRKHDPENALYDYLAALQLWNVSASYDWSVEPEDNLDSEEYVEDTVDKKEVKESTDELNELDEYWVLTIHDPATFAMGLERFLAAQQLPFLAIGEAGYPSVLDFLASSNLRKTDQVEFAVSRLVTFRHSMLFYDLWRWQNVRANEARKAGDRKQEMVILRQSLRFYNQAISPDETTALDTLTTFGVLRRHDYQQVLDLHATDPASIAANELEAIKQREEVLRIKTAKLEKALTSLNEDNYAREYAATWNAAISTVVSVSAGVLFIVAGLLLLVGRVFLQRVDNVTKLGIWRHTVAWTLACGITFVVLGMAPAEMISHEAQRIAILSGIWLVAACLTAAAVWLVVRLMQRRKLRFRLATLFAIMTGVAVFSALWPLMAASFDGLAQYPPELWLHAKGWNGIDAEVLRIAIEADKGTWHWSAMQWFVHGGQYVGLVAALLLTVAWYAWGSARKSNKGFLTYWSQELRSRWSNLVYFAGRSALGAAICWLFLYLLIAPKAVQIAEAEYQYKMRYFRSPEAHWAKIREAQIVVESSAVEMEAILEQVQFDLYGEGMIEKDYSQESN